MERSDENAETFGGVTTSRPDTEVINRDQNCWMQHVLSTKHKGVPSWEGQGGVEIR